MKTILKISNLIVPILAGALLAGCMSTQTETQSLGNVDCLTPPPARCEREGGCPRELLGEMGNVVDPVTGRSFFLDFPCGLQADEPVNFILNIHGAGSIANWQRHYFPAVDYVDDFNLVIATPSSTRTQPLPMWISDNDDAHLQSIVDLVTEKFGRENIRSFWLAGHSQGGMTSNRLVCTPFFRDKVDGWLSLSGGRIGGVEVSPDFFGDNGPPPSLAEASGGSGAGPGRAVMPDCDLSYIFTSGEKEITGLPEASPWAEKYQCDDRMRLGDLIDGHKGYVTGQAEGRPASWGREARPGRAMQYIYPRCSGGMVVADVLRMDKGHTEGLEPVVTRRLLEMMMAAPAGKIRQ